MKLKEIIKKCIFRLAGEDINNKITEIYLYVKDPYGREHMIHNRQGINPDRTYYLIRKKPGHKEEGMLSIFTYVMGRVDFADRNGMIPVVDIDQGGGGKINHLWAIFFIQKWTFKRRYQKLQKCDVVWV